MSDLHYIVGSNGDDVISGTDESDHISGLSGNDVIYGRGGSDVIWGGGGDDRIDTFAGYPGTSAPCHVYGGSGNDVIHAENVGDVVYGGGDNDLIYGRLDQALYGGGGDDGISIDFIYLGTPLGSSVLDGGMGYDVLTVGYGPAILITPDLSHISVAGFELLRTGGNLVLTAAQLASFDGIERIDSIDVGPRIEDVEISTSGTVDLTGKLAADLQLIGSAGADTVRLADSDPFSLEFWGGRLSDEAGADNVRGGGGSDSLYGLGGNDFLDGGAGVDRLYGYDGLDTLSGGSGNDFLYGQGGDDLLAGGNGADRCAGGSGTDSVRGGSGNDTLLGDAGSDRLYGEAGDDGLDGGTGKDQLAGGSGDDQLTGGPDPDLFVFAPGGYDLSGTRGQVDTVLDFHHGEDLISITGFGAGYDTAKEVLAAASVSGGSTFISLVEADGSPFPPVTTIELRGFVGLDASDFAILAP